MLRQDQLSGALRTVERAAPTPLERRALASLPDERRRVAFLAARLQRGAREGSAVGRILIPRIGASYVLVKGTSSEDLQSGPGIYSETSFPGTAGTTAIAGHRTTYLAPFRHIDALRSGDRIMLYMPYAHFSYTVTGERVVSPTDVSAAISQVGYPRLVLSACTPLFSAEKRLLVYARLTRAVPVGAARVLPGDPAIQPIEATSPRRPGASLRGLPSRLERPATTAERPATAAERPATGVPERPTIGVRIPAGAPARPARLRTPRRRGRAPARGPRRALGRSS